MELAEKLYMKNEGKVIAIIPDGNCGFQFISVFRKHTENKGKMIIMF